MNVNRKNELNTGKVEMIGVCLIKEIHTQLFDYLMLELTKRKL